MATEPAEPTPSPVTYDGRPETRAFWCGSLPHWDVLGRPVFLTLHVRGAIPPQAADRIRSRAAALRDREDTSYTRRLKLVFKEMEAWLDRSDSEAMLTQPGVADVVRDAIAERQNRRWWRVLQWVLMPSHLHILYVGGVVDMRKLMADFKRWTGHRVASVLGRDGSRFWQDEWFDHWSRSADETDRIASYIRENPVRAGLVGRHEDWRHGSWGESRGAPV